MNRKKLTGLWALAAILGFSIGVIAGPGYPVIVANWLGDGARANTSQFQIRIPSSGASAIFVPGTTNTNALGSTSLRFSNVFTTLLNVSGAATLSGTVTTNQANISVQVSTAPRTSTTAVVTSTGTLIWNSTDGGLCVSSGTTQSTMVASSAPTTACGH